MLREIYGAEKGFRKMKRRGYFLNEEIRETRQNGKLLELCERHVGTFVEIGWWKSRCLEAEEHIL